MLRKEICKAVEYFYSGDDRPRFDFPSVVGRLQTGMGLTGIYHKDAYVGDEAESKRGILNLKYPIECGVVTNWEDMEKIWHHIYYKKLQVDPKERPVLLIDTLLSPKENREKMTETMFEKFNTPALHITNQNVLSLYASGRPTGIVINSGEGVSCIAPVFDRFLLPDKSDRLDFAGKDVTSKLSILISIVRVYNIEPIKTNNSKNSTAI